MSIYLKKNYNIQMLKIHNLANYAERNICTRCAIASETSKYFLFSLQFTETYFQLKCPKQLNEDNSIFEINFGSGTYTRDWRLCGLRMFQGGKQVFLQMNQKGSQFFSLNMQTWPRIELRLLA